MENMTADEYLRELFSVYDLVSVLSEKNGCRALRLRNRSNGRDMVFHSFPKAVKTYEVLYGMAAENLPLIYDVVELSDGQAVLEEYIDGITVAQMMEAEKYSYKDAKRVISAVCSALAILHGRGLVHRDVKPENVMIDGGGRVVLIDFNASRQVTNATRDTVVLGSVGYASPEQMGISQSDSRADIYALGVMLNVMLTGKHPSEEIAGGRARRIVRKCTNVNPDDRYKSVRRLLDSL